MPLPALPPSNTRRYFIDYTSLGRQHTMVVRTNGVGTIAENLAYINGVIGNMTTVMRESDSVLRVRIAEPGSDVTFPFSTNSFQGQLSGAATIWDQDPESVFWSITGRGISTGRKVRYDMYTPVRNGSYPDNNRYEVGENTFVDTFFNNFTAAIIAGPTPAVQGVTIGGDVLLFNNYVNIAHNAYWQRKQRRSG